MRHVFELFSNRNTFTSQVVRKALFGITLIALGVFICANETKAQVPTLEGETFQNADLRNSKIECSFDATKGGQITFRIQGVAIGPYPGKFEEAGTIFFDFSGLIIGGHLDFAVFTDTVTLSKGSKRPLDGKAFCTVDERTGLTTLGATIPTLEYSAFVEGTTDSGTATLDLFASIDQKVVLTTLQFTEIFHSSNVVRSTLGKVTGGGTIVPPENKNGITFGFNAQNTDQGMKGAGTIIDHNAGMKVKILDVQTFVISGTHATFTGRAEVNGVEEKYQIDVEDFGEPGTGLETFKIVTGSYGGGGTLSGGNIQIHK